MKKFLPILVYLLFGCNYQKDLENNEILLPEAFFAINNWSAQRAYPYGYVNDKKFFNEFIDVKNKTQNTRLSSPNNTWETMGPHNRGGRTLCVASNPQNSNTIFAGSASGGLWRSYKKGDPYSWERIVTGYPVLGVNSIAISPTDSNTIIIGTGEVYSYQGSNIGISVRTNRGSFGIGILKSTDGGNTWTKTLNWQYSEQHGVQIIKFNSLNENTVWAGTSVGTYKSTDGGGNWNIVDSTLMVTDIEINPLDTNKVLIACGNLSSPGGGVYKTMNGGNSWQQVNGIPNPVVGKIHLCQAPSDPNIVYASVGDGYNTANQSTNNTYLCKSTDAGDTWSVVNNFDYAKYQGWFSHDIAVHPTNPDAIICAGVNIYQSDDGGQTLTSISTSMHVDHHFLSYNNNDVNQLYVGNDGGVYKGIVFESQNDITTSFNASNGSGGVMFDISTSNNINLTGFGLNLYSGQKTVYIYYKNGTHIGFENDSLAWIFLDSITVTSGGSGGSTLVNLSSTLSCIQGQTYGFFLSNSVWPDFRYIAGNATGSLQSSDPNISIYEGVGRRSKYFNSQIFQDRKFSGTVYYNVVGVPSQTNYTYTFTQKNDGYQTSQYYNGFANSRQDSGVAIGGRQDNGSAKYTGTLLWDKVLGADGAWCAIDPNNDNIMYASYQRARIHKSTNGGNSFSQIFSPSTVGIPTSGPVVPQTAPFVLSEANPDVLYVGTSYLAKSINAGNSWTLMNGAIELNGNPLISMASSCQDEDILYVATSPIVSQVAVLITIDGGNSFTDITGNLPDRYPVDLAVDANNDSVIYVVLSGFGTSHIYKSEDRGNNWIDIGNGLPDVPTSAVFIDPAFPSHIYVGNDIGVFVSTDGGNSWHDFRDGLPEVVSILDLTISLSNRKLRAATHGNGLYQISLLEQPLQTNSQEINILIDNIQIFPNPSRDIFNLTFTSNEKQDLEIRIINVIGERVFVENKQQFIGQYTKQINLGEYPKAIYFLEIETDDGVITKKLILQ
jgi:photosystem II stability/assembly factor-like uncharacterized protein